MADGDPLLRFLSADTARRAELLGDDSVVAAVRLHLGEAAFGQLQQVLATTNVQHHLGAASAPNLVFVPGVMGSLLHNETRSGVAWLDVRTRAALNRLRLDPAGVADADANDRIKPFNVDYSYEPFASAILRRADFGHRTFAYDWRKMYSHSTSALRDLIVRMRAENGGQDVHVVAHSMGGLMLRATLMAHGDELFPLLGRIAFVGTPHYGSASIAGYLKNHFWGREALAILGMYLDRETFRSLWGVLSLMPAPAGVYPGSRPGQPAAWPAGDQGDYRHPCANFDLYDAAAWKLDLSPAATHDLQTILTAVGDFHRDLSRWHRELLQDHCDKMLMVIGVGYKSLFRMESVDRLGLWSTMVKTTERIEGHPHRDGDGRVPIASARLERVRTKYVKGLHGGLTNLAAVYSDVFAWLKNEEMNLLADTPEDALGGHLSGAAPKSDAPALDGSAHAVDDDPGYLDLDQPPGLDLNQAELRLKAGAVPDFDLLKIL